MNKIETISIFNTTIYSKGRYDYTIEIQKFTNEILIKKEDVFKDKLAKQFIELLIKDILFFYQIQNYILIKDYSY